MDNTIIISLDDAFNVYESNKRTITNKPTHYYDTEKREFIKIKGGNESGKILFINSYELCLQVIDEYLNQPGMEEYKEAFNKEAKNAKNRIVSFLWFFEHIDGGYSFDAFEIEKIERVLKKWCKKNNFDYCEPEAYRVEHLPGYSNQ